MPANGRWDLIRRLKVNMDSYSDLHEVGSEVLRVIWMDDCLQCVSYVIQLHDILLALNYTSFGFDIYIMTVLQEETKLQEHNTKPRYCTGF